jgi:D-alanine-D-alanine ligase
MTLVPPCAPLPWRRVVFVADISRSDDDVADAAMRFDLEKSDPDLIAEVLDAITALGLEAVHVENPRALIDSAGPPGEVVVFSTFGGERSRNRLLLVPAVAEVLGINYVGMDAVGHALAANKHEAKRLASECGVLTPRSRIIRRPADLALCDEFPPPYVIKPVAEGSSIGIGPRNLIRDAAAGRRLAAELLNHFAQPILIEAFVPGREVSLICIESEGGWHEALVEMKVAGHPDYFDSHLFDAEEKQERRLSRSVQLVSEPLHSADHVAVHRFLEAVGHFGYGRVDGKLHDGRFHFLELTPDAWLGRRGQVAEGFARLGWSYEQVMAEILRSASLRPRDRVASG